MRFRWPGARTPIPRFQSAGRTPPVDLKPPAFGSLSGQVDKRLVREAIRAKSLAKQEGAVWDAYAGCERAPFGWECQ